MIGGPCPECGDELAADQRYCITCGHRVDSPLAPSYLPGSVGERGEVSRGFPIPIPIATTFAAVALGFGVIMGTAISPNLSGLVAGEHVDGPTVAVAPEDEGEPGSKPDKSSKGGGGGGGTGSGSSFDSSFGSGFYGTTGSTTGTTTTPGTDTGTGGVAPPPPKPKPDPDFLNGTVIHTNQVAGSYSIASGGSVSAIHAKTLPSIGIKVKVPIKSLANGTYAEAGERVKTGTATKAKFTGVVTYSKQGTAAPNPDVYAVSNRGSSVLVFLPDPTGVVTPPVVGALITTNVDIKTSAPTVFPDPNLVGPCGVPTTPFPNPALFPGKQLWQRGALPPTPPVVGATVIETVTQKTCTTPVGRAVLSSDDIRYSGSDEDLLTGVGVDPARLVPGQALIASVTIIGGVLTDVTGTASDFGTKAADDPATAQGNLDRVARKTDRRIAQAVAKRARR